MALFVALEQFLWGGFLGLLAALLIVSFFVTSADSATFVLGMLTSKGNPNPAAVTKLIWGVAQSTIAAALLVERWRYRASAAASPDDGWQKTDERFVDPESGQTMRVLYNPRTGERRYEHDTLG